MEWDGNNSTVPMDIIEAIKSRREWWILRDAFQIEPEVRTIAHLSVTYIDLYAYPTLR